MRPPRISIVTPSYNQGRYLAENLASVAEQGYASYEHIVIDGASSDESVDVLASCGNPRMRWVSEPDEGQAHALNKGFRRATGDILCWLNADDVLLPGALARVACAFQTSGCDIVAGICELTDGENVLDRHMTSCADGPLPLDPMLDLKNGWDAGQFFYQPEVFFSRELWERAGASLREELFFSMDYELWSRFARLGATLRTLGVPLVRFRVHDEQKTADIRGFNEELAQVRASVVAEYGEPAGSGRGAFDARRSLRVAMVNDLGVRYGAGIAHGRLAAAFALAGHEVRFFRLLDAVNDAGGSYRHIVARIDRYAPDIVVVGNLHGVERAEIGLLEALDERLPVFFVCHDFWLITGRCAYMQDCPRYLERCDDACPTAAEYPALPPDRIAGAWSRKREFLRRARNLTLLANSTWTRRTLEQPLEAMGSRVRVMPVQLGAPAHVFQPAGRAQARAHFGIGDNDFAVAFSSSSLGDARKGAAHLRAALPSIGLEGLVLLAIGRVDCDLRVPGARLVELGYIDDDAAVAQALRAADVCVGPSAEETFGQVFLEAALCGTPSVGFDAAGIRDAIVDGVTGYRVPAGDAAGLAEKIRELAMDAGLRDRLRQSAAAYAAGRFSLEASYHSLFQVLDQHGLIDALQIQHKIAFADRGATPDFRRGGYGDATLVRRGRRAVVGLINEAIALLPGSVTAGVRNALPKRWELRVARWLSDR